MIKNIIFDLGNVLLLFDEDEIISHYTNNKDEKEYISKEIIRSKEWDMLDEGTITLADAINNVNERCHHKYDKLTYTFWTTWFNYQYLNKKTYNLLKYLKCCGYKIYILSNLSIPVYNHFKDLELFNIVDGKIISSLENKIKPNKDIYELLLNRYNLKAEESIFIDDREKNIEAANELNIKGRQVNIDDYKDVIDILREYVFKNKVSVEN